MRINVGSLNEVKIAAVREALAQYDRFHGAIVDGVEVSSGVSKQPMTLEETIQGASQRAHNAYRDHVTDYSIGIESGCLRVNDHWNSDWCFDVTVCAIYDGKQNSKRYLGTSRMFAVPSAVARVLIQEKCDLNEAFYRAGYTDNPVIGSAEGVIGVLTNGALDRKAYTKEAVQMALIGLVGPRPIQ